MLNFNAFSPQTIKPYENALKDHFNLIGKFLRV